MPSPLFVVQQWLAPVVTFWPVWAISLGFIVVGRLGNSSSSKITTLGVWLGGVVLVVLLGTRGAMLLLSPYSERQVEVKEVADAAGLPFVVLFRDGNLHVTVSDATANTGKSPIAKVIGSGVEYQFIRDQFEMEKEANKPGAIDALVLKQQTPGTIMNQFWRNIDVTVPSTWNTAQYYVLVESTGEVDLRGMESDLYEVLVYYSSIKLTLPNSVGGKNVVIRGGSGLSGQIMMDLSGPSYKVVDPFGVIRGKGAVLKEIEKGVFIAQGAQSGEITLRVVTANSATSVNALELVVVNPHNE